MRRHYLGDRGENEVDIQASENELNGETEINNPENENTQEEEENVEDEEEEEDEENINDDDEPPPLEEIDESEKENEMKIDPVIKDVVIVCQNLIAFEMNHLMFLIYKRLFNMHQT